MDVGIRSSYWRGGKQSSISKTCDNGVGMEHPARYCARKFLNRVDELKIMQASMGEIAMEVLTFGDNGRANDYSLRESEG